ncbi:MAG: hypothetical protein N2258_07905 [Brevinematales bacterium]|nr:hypothetical protein [Brevinematales bacterium]
MGRRDIVKQKKYFISNVIWINMKRLSHQLGFRTLTFLINLMFLFIFIFKLDLIIYYYVFIIVSFANILFIITRIQAEKDSIILLRSFGASKFFIVFDHVFQLLFQVIIASGIFVVIFPILFFFKKIGFLPFLFLFAEVLIILLVSSINSFLTIKKLEKELNA